MPQLKRFLRRQPNYIAIAVAIHAALWAADRQADLGSTLICTLPLCNLIVLVRDHLGFLAAQFRDDATLIVITALPTADCELKAGLEMCAGVSHR